MRIIAQAVEDMMELSPFSPQSRVEANEKIRHAAAEAEEKLGAESHPTNTDEEDFLDKAGNFTKGLAHDADGVVVPAAYDALTQALAGGGFGEMESVPGAGRLVGPMGSLTFDLEGRDPATARLRDLQGNTFTPFSVASAEKAAEMVELYWSAYLRDVPFAWYHDHPEVAKACEDISGLSGYVGPRDATSGAVTPALLFRYKLPGALNGPIVSQFLLRTVMMDGIPIEPRIITRRPVLEWGGAGTFTAGSGVDFLTSWDEWLKAQNGESLGNKGTFDSVRRFVRSARDLGHLAASDALYSTYLRAALMLLNFFEVPDWGGFPARQNSLGGTFAPNPYSTSTRQFPFCSFGIGDLLMQIGNVTKAERHAFYQKWNVHRHLRPEEYGGLVHKRVKLGKPQPIHADVVNSSVLPLIVEYNRAVNQRRFGTSEETYLLPQELESGCPAHPSLPAGHAFSAGACVTILKAFFADTQLSNDATFVASADGTSLIPWKPGAGEQPLTVHGELNKLAHNMSEGRNMSGVHWRSDNFSGLMQGEAVAVSVLNEAVKNYPEPNARFSFKGFAGDTINIEATDSIDAVDALKVA